MGHLTTETLARLVDDTPSAEDRRHLDECRLCASELEFLRSQTEALGALPALRPPPGDWEGLEARLLSQGLIREPESGRVEGTGNSGQSVESGHARPAAAPADESVIPFPRTFFSMRAGQIAAALVLFLGGSVFGSSVLAPRSGAGDPASSPLGMAALPTGSGTSEGMAQVATLDEAAAEVQRAEQEYIEALVRYRRLMDATGRGDPAQYDPAARYAALEAVTAASQAAVREAPMDPFLNGILASVMAERQAFQQQLAQANDNNWY